MTILSIFFSVFFLFLMLTSPVGTNDVTTVKDLYCIVISLSTKGYEFQ